MESLLNLLVSEQWHKAVDPVLICDTSSQTQRENRANAILNIVVKEVFTDMKFLDIGCGQGDCVNVALKRNTASATGYDIKQQWDNNDNLTTDWEVVKSKAPYNIILIYDVLDHCESPVDLLKQAKGLLAPRGKMYVRCHPWCSRHATHLYQKINKAYIHLVFTDEELQQQGYTSDKIAKVIHPIKTYSGWFVDAGLTVKSRSISTEIVEDFFTTGEIAERIKSHWKDSKSIQTGQLPIFQMEQQFHDYVLK